MSKKLNSKIQARNKRQQSIRKKIAGTAECPRLAVFRSLNHIYAQLIDDDKQITLLTVSDLTEAVKAKVKKGTTKTDKSKLVGTVLAERAKEQNVELVVFDRGGFRYHGRVKALADAAREAGLTF